MGPHGPVGAVGASRSQPTGFIGHSQKVKNLSAATRDLECTEIFSAEKLRAEGIFLCFGAFLPEITPFVSILQRCHMILDSDSRILGPNGLGMGAEIPNFGARWAHMGPLGPLGPAAAIGAK